MLGKIHHLGPFVVCLRWDKQGHWVTAKSGHKHALWLWFGPSEDSEGLRVYNLIVGPLGLAVAKKQF